MILEVDTVKGFVDSLPPESQKRDKIRKIVEKIYKLYGFLPIETPVIEYDELMRPDNMPSEQEDEAISDRFRLRDRANRNLGLRYEFTFQLARILKQNPTIKMPFRRYQIGEVFRDEPLRAGRTRQFTQCDIDILGDSSISADAECIAVVSDIFKELGIEIEIAVNNRKLIDAIIESVELLDRKQVMREVDKLEKIGEDMVKTNLKKYGDANQIVTLFKLLDKDIKFFKSNAFEGAEELLALQDKLKQYKIETKFKPTLVRGLGYYTGNVFEIFIKGTKTSLCGGGRYDKTVGKYLNREIPAVGISFSIEAIMGLCPDQISKLQLDPIAKVALISIGKDKETMQLAKSLRESGISTLFLAEKPGKMLEYANSYQIPFVIFIGEDEVKKKKFKIRDMNSGEEKLLVEKSIISILSKR